jgi:hypothetical protein
MSYVIRIIGDALGNVGPHDGRYLEKFTPDVDEYGLGRVESTDDIARALQFPSTLEAGEFWKQQSRVHPLRDDGKPNRPLTAFSIEFVYVKPQTEDNQT